MSFSSFKKWTIFSLQECWQGRMVVVRVEDASVVVVVVVTIVPLFLFRIAGRVVWAWFARRMPL